MEHYDIAQICLNGHLVNSAHIKNPYNSSNHCPSCGKPTITACPNCNSNIRGAAVSKYAILTGTPIKIPAYCRECGHMYPWTKQKIDLAAELIRQDLSYTGNQQKELITLLPELVTESPATELAKVKIIQFLKNCLPDIKTALINAIVTFACSDVVAVLKKML